MPKYTILIDAPRPYFAELPYALWGEVSYDSEGNCRRPTDRNWTDVELTNRKTRQRVTILGARGQFEIESDEPETAARVTGYLLESCSGTMLDQDPAPHVGDWTYAKAQERTARIRSEFPRVELKPFDSDLFWGSWKWVGWYGSRFTWVGRWIMNSLLIRDTRAVFLCIDWLKQPPVHPDQSAALRYALEFLTGKRFWSNQDWIRWYEGNLFRRAGKLTYPEPDFDKWLADLKRS